MRLEGHRVALAMILAIGGAWRLLEARARYNEPLAFGDEYQYFAMGLGVRDGGLLADMARPWRPSARRAPLYPALVGLAAGPRDEPGRVRLLQAWLSILVLLLVYALGTVFHSRLAGLAAAALYAASAPSAAWCGTLFIETVFGLLVLCVAGALAWWSRAPTGRSFAAFGLALAASLLCRSNLFAVPFLAAAWLLWKDRAAGARRAALVLAAALLPLLPWAARNARWLDRFIWLDDRAGTPLVYLATAGAVRAAPHAGFSIESTPTLEEQEGELSQAGDVEELYDRMQALARRNLLERPAVFAKAWALRAAVIVSTFARQLSWPCAALLVAGLGLLRGPPWRALYALLGYFLGLYSLVAFQDRYLLPALPLGLLLAGAAGAELAARLGGTPTTAGESGLERRLLFGCAACAGLMLAASLVAVAREFGVPRAVAARVLADEGWRLVEAARPAEALESFERAAAAAPKWPEPAVGRATARLAANDPAALHDLNEAIRLSYRPWAGYLDTVTAGWAVAALNARAGHLQTRGLRAAAAADRLRAARLKAGIEGRSKEGG